MEKQIPYYEYKEYFEKRNDYALLIPTWNEGERIRIELNRLKEKDIPSKIDIFLLDAGSSDGSLDESFLKEIGIRAILTIKRKGQANAYKSGFSKASSEKYKGVVTVDALTKKLKENTIIKTYFNVDSIKVTAPTITDTDKTAVATFKVDLTPNSVLFETPYKSYDFIIDPKGKWLTDK